MPRQLLTIVVLASAISIEAGAQCPDGSRPPCRAATAPAGTARRINPPLDDRSWIVVPFDNLSKSADVEWMRVAAVNLLYLDMSRWRDIRVIDDERVADLMREVPEAGGAQTLSLSAALAVAKRAGSGKLVMGDVLKLGERTTVTAKVFDVKTGTRLRSLREEATVADSVMPLFGRLARKILDVAPPANANVGALGTQSVGAYQEYVEGIDALNRYNLASAQAHFDEALKRDSTFALAHYKQSIVIGWANVTDPSRRTHAEMANRLSAGLPPRERALIAGQLQQSIGEWTKACDTYQGLVRLDSADVEAWYGVGECFFHNPTIEAVGGDTTRLRFRSDYDQSIRAFERVLRLDPTYHLAYQHIIDALTAERHPSVCHANNPANRCVPYSAFMIRSGDSLLAVPVTAIPGGPGAGNPALVQQGARYVQTSSRRRNLDVARTFAEAWVQASPNEPQAHRGLARVLLLQGRVQEASAELVQVKTQGTLLEEFRRRMEQMEIDYKLGRGTEAIRAYDSVRADRMMVPGSSTVRFGNAIAGFAPAFGRMREIDSLVAEGMRLSNAPDAVRRYQKMGVWSAVSGVMNDSLAAVEREVFEQALPRGPAAATRSIGPSLALSLRAARTTWPALDTTVRDLWLQPAIALSKSDTARLRAAAIALDSVAAALTSAGVSDTVFSLVAAEAWLVLRDTVSALKSVRFALDRASATSQYFPQSAPSGLPPVYFVPRSMLLRADLAAATGQRDEARVWYKRFIDIWATADPGLQPLVERARKALAALGTSS